VNEKTKARPPVIIFFVILARSGSVIISPKKNKRAELDQASLHKKRACAKKFISKS
jgi:hypothetical protein